MYCGLETANTPHIHNTHSVISRVDTATHRGARVFLEVLGWVIDPSCPGRESVCLGMMKSSTCPHSSNPLHILIITNLQTYSRGHTHARRQTHTHISLPKPLPPTCTSVKIQLWWRGTDAGCKCLWQYKSAEYFQRTTRCQLLLAGCRNPNLTVEVQSYRSHRGAKDFLCFVHFPSRWPITRKPNWLGSFFIGKIGLFHSGDISKKTRQPRIWDNFWHFAVGKPKMWHWSFHSGFTPGATSMTSHERITPKTLRV